MHNICTYYLKYFIKNKWILLVGAFIFCLFFAFINGSGEYNLELDYAYYLNGTYLLIIVIPLLVVIIASIINVSLDTNTLIRLKHNPKYYLYMFYLVVITSFVYSMYILIPFIISSSLHFNIIGGKIFFIKNILYNSMNYFIIAEIYIVLYSIIKKSNITIILTLIIIFTVNCLSALVYEVPMLIEILFFDNSFFVSKLFLCILLVFVDKLCFKIIYKDVC
ncbi:hypothetical protein K0040_07245 [Terrisporobacter petrolearius]|uniref:hypothetical protein n=1 Tax=Terrisporobacter petrolearius TaxID=1460447 RepID=UPI001D162580|nr:hypothetical protein [Terrisporobacter petrolearius]MCC3864109.1 hypothetical protein [Terrisporobacter petrolearius]